MYTSIKIKCLGCGIVFDAKTNGLEWRHYERDNSIRHRRNTEPLKCECGSEELIFNDYYNVKLKYPKWMLNNLDPD